MEKTWSRSNMVRKFQVLMYGASLLWVIYVQCMLTLLEVSNTPVKFVYMFNILFYKWILSILSEYKLNWRQSTINSWIRQEYFKVLVSLILAKLQVATPLCLLTLVPVLLLRFFVCIIWESPRLKRNLNFPIYVLNTFCPSLVALAKNLIRSARTGCLFCASNSLLEKH